MVDRISTQETARRLGVKVETVYAYVSRGVLTSRQRSGGRGSTFDPAEVDRLAGRGAGRQTFRFPGVATSIALVTADGLFYRGRDAGELAARRSFEEVAGWIWTGRWRAERFQAPAATRAAVRRAVDALPAGCDPIARLQVAVAVAGAVDHLRFDVRPAAVQQMARVAIGGMVEALAVGADGAKPSSDGGVCERLWSALAGPGADSRLRPVLSAALVVLADRGLAASTVAVRAAASTRAHPYAVLSAGLGALDGPLHGGAGRGAYRLLDRVVGTGAVGPVLAEHLRGDGHVPGLGLHDGPYDPRAQWLLEQLATVPAAAAAVHAVDATVEALRPYGARRPNVDLAVAALSVAAGMPPGAGEAIFAVARSVGWIGHALEEYGERALRWRGREVYGGDRPGASGDDDVE